MFNLFKKDISNQEDFNKWIDKMSLPETNELKAVNFGLFESTKGYSVYLIGSNTYEENNDDWACNEDFVPKEKYFNRNLEFENWDVAIDRFTDLIEGFINSSFYASSILDRVKYVTCGFDDGELKMIKKPSNNTLKA